MKANHELLSAIQKRIEAHEEIMNSYAIDYIENGTLVHHNIYEDYHHRKKVVMGLKEALAIVNDILSYQSSTVDVMQHLQIVNGFQELQKHTQPHY